MSSNRMPSGSFRSSDGGEDEQVHRFPSCEEIARRLVRKFPMIDREIVLDFAYAVSINKYDYGQAKQMLKNLAEISLVEAAVVDAEKREEKQQQQQQQQQKLQQEVSAKVEHEAASMLERDHLRRHHVEQPLQNQKRQLGPPIASAMLQAHPDVSEISSVGFSDSEVLLYSTSMTSIQQVRDHTRLLKNLLYIRRIRYSELDLADNNFLQRRLASLCGMKGGASELKLPVLFVGEKPVGGYEYIQDLEDRDMFMGRLRELGFIYEPTPLPDVTVADSGEADDDEYFDC